jgi:hypothetical protein
MKKIIILLGACLSMAACQVDVEGGFDDLDGPNKNEKQELKISSGSSYEDNSVVYDREEMGGSAEVTQVFIVPSNEAMLLQGGGGSHFSLNCDEEPSFKQELVRFDASGNEISREEIFYDQFQVEKGENVEVHASIKNIHSSCLAITYTFYVSHVE